MSEAAPERTARAPAPKAGGNFFTKKYGPLPGWGWLALAATGGVVFIWYRNRKAAAAATTTSATTAAGTAATDTGNPGADTAALQSEIQQLQGAESEQEQDITQEAGQEKKLAGSEKTQAAVNRSQTEAIQDLNAEEKQDNRKPPRSCCQPPQPRPRPVAGAGRSRPSAP